MAEYSLDKLKSILAKVANRDVSLLSESDNLFERGYLDSLMLIKFIVTVENDFGMMFRQDSVRFENFKSLGALRDLLEKEYRYD